MIIFPHIKTLDPSSIIRKSIENIEGTPCAVFQRKYQIVDAQDVETIKNIMMGETDFIHPSFKHLIGSIEPSAILDSIKGMNPVFYMGLKDSKCAVIGTAFRCYTEKAYMSVYDFDNKLVREEFEKIMREEIQKQRK